MGAPPAGPRLRKGGSPKAATYLEGVKTRLAREGIAVSAVVKRGEPGRVLLDRLARPDTELIVMGTHGRSGVSAVWAGSVASRIVAQAARPVLLIRIPRVE